MRRTSEASISRSNEISRRPLPAAATEGGGAAGPSGGVPRTWVCARAPGERYERGAVVIESAFLQTDAAGSPGRVAWIHEGLVRATWNRSKLAPSSRATALVAGDGCWIGADVFQHGENIFRWVALAPTVASIVTVGVLREEAPREVLVHAMENVARDWCTAASLLSLGTDSLERRALLLLHHLSRQHPRPEIEVRQSDLADMLGVARQTLHPVLKKLEATGLLGLGYGEIVVADPDELFRAIRETRS